MTIIKDEPFYNCWTCGFYLENDKFIKGSTNICIECREKIRLKKTISQYIDKKVNDTKDNNSNNNTISNNNTTSNTIINNGKL